MICPDCLMEALMWIGTGIILFVVALWWNSCLTPPWEVKEK